MSEIKLDNIIKIYNKGKENELKALDVVELSITDGEFISIMGTSGAGKTTLLYILGCLDSPTSGSYILNGEKLSFSNDGGIAKIRNKTFGFVFQEFALVPQQTVFENVEIPLIFSKAKLRKNREHCKKVLDDLKIGDLINKKCAQLSGGQKQRVAIARALVNEPDIILADEPTGALDSKTTGEIMNIFRELNARGKTVIIVTHDPGVASVCRRHITISDGLITKDEI